MRIKAHFLGGPIDGQVVEVDAIQTFLHVDQTTRESVEYVRKLETKPHGPELAIAYFAPVTWDRNEFNEALQRSLPGTQR